MKKTLSIFCALIFLGCGEDKKPETTIQPADAAKAETRAPDQPLAHPALYSNWEMGSRDNTNTVLNMYKYWDEVSIEKMKDLFDDSIVIDKPHGIRVVESRNQVVERLVNFRKTFSSTSNQIISVYPLVNKETNDEWVAALIYNKWTYKDNVRDSMLFQDLWRLKNGRINYLLSLEQTPSRLELKQLEKLSGKIK